MKIAIACDHGAFELKEALIPFIKSLGYSVRDFGTNSTQSCDYPDYAAAAARAVADGDCDKGIVLCTTGIGVSITANKINGIRCALLSDVESAKMTRLHNDTNMMALGAAVVNQSLAFSIVETWLATPFSNEDRHQRRIDKMMDCEVTPQKGKRDKKKAKVKKCRKDHTNPIFKLLTRLLCIPLVLSLLLLPLATAITNITDPTALAKAIVEANLLGAFMGGAETPETTEPESSEEPTGAVTDENAGSSSGASQSETDADTNTETDTGTNLPTSGLPAGMDLSALLGSLGSLGGLLDAGILDPEILTEDLGINAEDLDTDQLMADLAGSKLVEDLSSALIEDTFNAAMSSNPEEYQSAITGEALKEIISNNSGTIVELVKNNLTEEAKEKFEETDLDTKLEEAVNKAVEAVPTEELDKALENYKPAEIMGGVTQDPTIASVLRYLKAIRTGALRAIVLLLVMALSVVVIISGLPNLRGLASVGKSGVVAAGICYGISLVLGTPALPEVLNNAVGAMGEAAAMITPFLSIITSLLGSLASAFETCAIVYAVLGVVIYLGATVFRGVFRRIFDAIFAIE